MLGALLKKAGAFLCRFVGKEPEAMTVASRDAGRWAVPGGDIELGDGFFEAAERRALEEAGTRSQITAPIPSGLAPYFKSLKAGGGRPASPASIEVLPFAGGGAGAERPKAGLDAGARSRSQGKRIGFSLLDGASFRGGRISGVASRHNFVSRPSYNLDFEGPAFALDTSRVFMK
jgi:hypothetical protein